MRDQRGVAFVQILWVLAALLVIAAVGWHVIDRLSDTPVKFPTPYQAVLLTNGPVYFGHLDGMGIAAGHPCSRMSTTS